MGGVPIRGRSGIVGTALVDDADLDMVSSHKWHFDRDGYAVTSIHHPNKTGNRYVLPMHRLICGLEYGDKRQPDHVNRNKLDNTRSNLRIGSLALNGQNRGSNRGSASRFRGVHKSRNHWRAAVILNGKNTHLGCFATEEEAARVASEWRAEYMEFAVEGDLIG